MDNGQWIIENGQWIMDNDNPPSNPEPLERSFTPRVPSILLPYTLRELYEPSTKRSANVSDLSGKNSGPTSTTQAKYQLLAFGVWHILLV